MNIFQELINGLQDLVAHVPELIQPLIIVLAGAIPAIEGDLAAVIGIIGGINPIVAGIAGAAGNFLTVLLTVILTARARTAIVNRRARAAAMAGGPGVGSANYDTRSEDALVASAKPESKGRAKGRAKLEKWFVRFGVPGASLLAPLALPTQVTSAILVASGSPRAWVLLWQAAAIVIWTAFASTSAWLALTVVFLV